MKLRVVKKLQPLFYANEHGLPRARATVDRIAPESATKVGEEKRATIKGAVVTFGIASEERTIDARLERKKLVRLAHALGKIGTAPGDTADTTDLIGGEVDIYIETARRSGTERIARFTAVDGTYGG